MTTGSKPVALGAASRRVGLRMALLPLALSAAMLGRAAAQSCDAGPRGKSCVSPERVYAERQLDGGMYHIAILRNGCGMPVRVTARTNEDKSYTKSISAGGSSRLVCSERSGCTGWQVKDLDVTCERTSRSKERRAERPVRRASAGAGRHAEVVHGTRSECRRTVFRPCFDECGVKFPGAQRVTAWKSCVAQCTEAAAQCEWPQHSTREARLLACTERHDRCVEACPMGRGGRGCIAACATAATACEKSASSARPTAETEASAGATGSASHGTAARHRRKHRARHH